MRKWRNTPLYFLILCLLLTMSACQKKAESSQKQPKDEFKILESPLEELDTSLVDVISKTDLIPYYEKQIAAKKQKEAEEKQTISPAGGAGQAQAPPPAKEPFKPEPITINDTLLFEIVQQEKPEEEQEKEEKQPIPEEIIFIWDDINTTISGLHEQWNELKPKLTGVNIPETALTEFGNSLNNLTIAATAHTFMETLINANEATGSFGEFMKASKDKALSPLYNVKYYTRSIVIHAANQNDAKANEDLQALKNQADTLGAQLVEKKSNDQADQLKVAVDDLESALRAQDLNLLKIEASVLIKTIAAIKENLSEA